MQRMKNYRPLQLQHLGLSLPSLRVHRLRLNQQMPEVVWTTHTHDHGQILIYLAGRGKQQMSTRSYDCRPGSVIYVPAGESHAYSRQMGVSPLILVIDLDLEVTRATAHPVSLLAQAELTKVRSAVSRLCGLRLPDQRENMLAVVSIVAAILDRALLAAGWLKPFNRFGDRQNKVLTHFAERLLERMNDSDISLEDMAKRAGYELTALNRKLKAESGFTLGQLRSKFRIQRAQLLIRRGLKMSEVAKRTGIPDSNYFSRWFRLQTGMTPRQFKKNPEAAVKL